MTLTRHRHKLNPVLAAAHLGLELLHCVDEQHDLLRVGLATQLQQVRQLSIVLLGLGVLVLREGGLEVGSRRDDTFQ